MNFFQLEVLLKVVETGSFTKAGDKIGLTQSGVSHNITSLENELGVALLKRGRNGVNLTTAGEYIIDHVRTIADNMSHINQKVAAMNGMKLGKLAIGSFPSFSAKYIPKLFSVFKESFPNIELRLYEGGYHDILKWIQDGTIDLGFTALPVADYVEFEHLLYDPLAVITHEDHHLSKESTINLEDFVGESFIMLRSGCETLIEEKFREANIKPTISYDSKDNQTALSMVREKLGITIMPHLALSEKPEKIHILPLKTEIVRDIGLVNKSAKEPTPIAKEFTKVVKEFFKKDE